MLLLKTMTVFFAKAMPLRATRTCIAARTAGTPDSILCLCALPARKENSATRRARTPHSLVGARLASAEKIFLTERNQISQNAICQRNAGIRRVPSAAGKKLTRGCG